MTAFDPDQFRGGRAPERLRALCASHGRPLETVRAMSGRPAQRRSPLAAVGELPAVPEESPLARRRSGQQLAIARTASVLHADLDGYEGYARTRPPRDALEILERFAEALAGVVVRHGGHLVGFGSHGMVAVFGAPGRLPAMERSALRAAQEICRIGPRQAHLGLPGRPSGLSAVVGVATGEAFVGSVRAGDRVFWSAAGSAARRAAEFQRLAHVLHSALVVDERSWREAGSAGAELEPRPRVAIPGFATPEDLYLLPPHAL